MLQNQHIINNTYKYTMFSILALSWMFLFFSSKVFSLAREWKVYSAYFAVTLETLKALPRCYKRSTVELDEFSVNHRNLACLFNLEKNEEWPNPRSCMISVLCCAQRAVDSHNCLSMKLVWSLLGSLTVRQRQ